VQAENRRANFSAYFFEGSFLSAGNLGRGRFKKKKKILRILIFAGVDILMKKF
jgi:hypothetical protein